jgi:hypothetical protein
MVAEESFSSSGPQNIGGGSAWEFDYHEQQEVERQLARERKAARERQICLAQFLNRSPKGTLLALVGLVSLRHKGHLALKSLKPSSGFDYEGCACGWGTAGHKMAHRGIVFRGIAVQLNGTEL